MVNIALIPARSGSKRCKNKNIRELSGKPLLAHTVELAVKSKLIDETFIITESQEYESIALNYGAKSIGLRPLSTAQDESSDNDWVKWFLDENKNLSNKDNLCILRPTNPFRTEDLIKRGFKKFVEGNMDSIRAVELCKNHPMKTWILNKDNSFMQPSSPFFIDSYPAHSVQYASLPEIYVQNGALEIFPVGNIKKFNNFSGFSISPIITADYEGFDINYEIDFMIAELLIEKGLVKI